MLSGFIQAGLHKIQGLSKDFKKLSYGLQGEGYEKKTDLHVKILLLKC